MTVFLFFYITSYLRLTLSDDFDGLVRTMEMPNEQRPWQSSSSSIHPGRCNLVSLSRSPSPSSLCFIAPSCRCWPMPCRRLQSVCWLCTPMAGLRLRLALVRLEPQIIPFEPNGEDSDRRKPTQLPVLSGSSPSRFTRIQSAEPFGSSPGMGLLVFEVCAVKTLSSVCCPALDCSTRPLSPQLARDGPSHSLSSGYVSVYP
ncbi:uncharacterized protein BJ171DRAFT_136855 [Polychytrium aggregatum]|uniref:uncharacterized protein n=1 Tax=Polychytrium aggregatum TaxID=110093 RepID=UPI0022FF021E|nr:uncharacterized protein BJ171DRAFT_136855 [Polychytrium aggregatum]KAI9203570.1 hypothetical protein BJ171DRAFT_136855 [Polychytrium aggregatum]